VRGTLRGQAPGPSGLPEPLCLGALRAGTPRTAPILGKVSEKRSARFWLLRLVLFSMLRAPDPSLHPTPTQHVTCSAVSGSRANFW